MFACGTTRVDNVDPVIENEKIETLIRWLRRHFQCRDESTDYEKQLNQARDIIYDPSKTSKRHKRHPPRSRQTETNKLLGPVKGADPNPYSPPMYE